MSEAGGPVLTVPHAPLAFHVMAKPTGAVCNLDCEYCFFLSKEMLYPGSRFRMAADLQETYIRQLLESHRTPGEVTVAWQGGEPTLMGLEFFRRSVELVRRTGRPGSGTPSRPTASCSTTNGARSSSSTISWWACRRWPAEIHDTYRVDTAGRAPSTG